MNQGPGATTTPPRNWKWVERCTGWPSGESRRSAAPFAFDIRWAPAGALSWVAPPVLPEVEPELPVLPLEPTVPVLPVLPLLAVLPLEEAPLVEPALPEVPVPELEALDEVLEPVDPIEPEAEAPPVLPLDEALPPEVQPEAAQKRATASNPARARIPGPRKRSGRVPELPVKVQAGDSRIGVSGRSGRCNRPGA